MIMTINMYNISGDTNRDISCTDSLICSEHHRLLWFRMRFMSDGQSDRWPIRCLWNGNAINGTCAPGPPSNQPVFYIKSNEWQQKVKEFRIKIGCNSSDIENANKLDELYVCKERCIQAGIGYISSIFIMTTLFISFTLLLMK
ncbi:Uncharacterized protein BM_BM6782 [Brugia malayi]|uniref:Bm6782 n=1 Tax=Brugia malayi TaxID=6279 RepID=A0A0H5SAM3_BRUMA|nr:Uncharacterized protein BM_BM6782 [Brugia malayi]CRZ25409.1 Bm6782 [Brugia malayi]VIO90580.1 Uncharacterized protein BM_BM6782 [Brugia malayi]